MARGWTEAKEVLIVAHFPDVKFEGGITSGSIDTMPVSGLILELRQCLYDTKYVKEYEQFKTMIVYPKDEHRQAQALGLLPKGYESLLAAMKRRKPQNKVANIKRHIEDTLIADGVDRMPKHLFERCAEVHYINLRGDGASW